MYSSLQKIDIATDTSPPLFFQTDHRDSDEIEAEPEISVLFGLARILNAKHHAASQKVDATVVYVALSSQLPAFLVDAIAAAGGVIEHGDQSRPAMPAPSAGPAELADRAFRGLAERVQRRTGLSDFAAVLRALEAEVLTEPPQLEVDEIGYWTRVCELSAVTGEILRARHGGSWIVCERSDLGFGFGPGDGSIALPSNRAQRFLADGEDESMFHLLASDNDMRGTEAIVENAPILPSLRHRREAERENMVFVPLLANSDQFPDVPVVAFGRDTPSAFAIATKERAGDVDKLHAEALANIAKHEVTVEDVELADTRLLAVTGSYYATEKILDVAFMKELGKRLGTPMLAVTVPRRGLMFATAAATKGEGMSVLAAVTRHESGTTRKISEAILIVTDGKVVGQVRIEGGPELPEPPKKKPGFLRRLFGRA